MASKPHFDVRLGGNVEAPLEVETFKFASARAQEIAAISQTLDDAKTGNLIFQRLPRHMRRRVMGHTIKRIPRSLREAYSQQLLKSAGGALVKNKVPSRKHRRRPANLLEEYNRRQRSFIWLETHIWHAKRFHMTKQWGYHIAHYPNDRSYRACYRAAANHCLLQDVSFLCCIELLGPLETLLCGLAKHTNSCLGLTFGAKSLLKGDREGQVMFYESDQFPWCAIGTVSFLWKPKQKSDTSDVENLWIWAHPAFHERIVDALICTFQLNKVTAIEPMEYEEEGEAVPPCKKIKLLNDSKNVEELKLSTRNIPFERAPKYKSSCGTIQMFLLKDALNRFRLTGPLSQAVLEEALQLVNDFDGKFSVANSALIINDDYQSSNQPAEVKEVTENLGSLIDADGQGRESHHKFWMSSRGVASPAELPPRMVLGLLVKDPRLQIPEKRSKAVPDKAGARTSGVPDLPPVPYSSPLWSADIRDIVTKSKLSTAELNALRSKLLVPGIVRTHESNSCSNDVTHSSPLENSVKAKIPILLVQRPGSQNPMTKRLGFGCGWDIILPLGWGMPFWLAFIFRCARPSGLREAESNAYEKGQSEFLPPDTAAGAEEVLQRGREQKDIYFRLPPNKRPNFIKLGVACPFQCEWANLIRDWISLPKGQNGLLCQPESLLPINTASSFFVIRDTKILRDVNTILVETWSTLQKIACGRSNAVTVKTMATKLPSFPNHEHSLLPVCVEALQKGVTEDLSLICIPSSEDIVNILDSSSGYDPVESAHDDNNHDMRLKMRKEHKQLLLRLRKRRVRAKRKQEEESASGEIPNTRKKGKKSTSPTEDLVTAYNHKMNAMWLLDTSVVGSVRNSCGRETAGFVTRGNFCLTEAKGCGVGYITFLSLQKLMEVWIKHLATSKASQMKSTGIVVLVRSPKSFQYRLAKLSLIDN